jgi:hypothetical protein
MSDTPRTPDFFKLIRANTQPINRTDYDALFAAAADFLYRSEVHAYYRSATMSWLSNMQLSPDDILERQGTTGWIDGNRLVGVSFYTAISEQQRDYGIEADLGIASVPGIKVDNQWELSTDGDQCWVTDYASLRTATAEEISRLIADLPLALAK